MLEENTRKLRRVHWETFVSIALLHLHHENRSPSESNCLSSTSNCSKRGRRLHSTQARSPGMSFEKLRCTNSYGIFIMQQSRTWRHLETFSLIPSLVLTAFHEIKTRRFFLKKNSESFIHSHAYTYVCVDTTVTLVLMLLHIHTDAVSRLSFASFVVTLVSRVYASTPRETTRLDDYENVAERDAIFRRPETRWQLQPTSSEATRNKIERIISSTKFLVWNSIEVFFTIVAQDVRWIMKIEKSLAEFVRWLLPVNRCPDAGRSAMKDFS